MKNKAEEEKEINRDSLTSQICNALCVHLKLITVQVFANQGEEHVQDTDRTCHCGRGWVPETCQETKYRLANTSTMNCTQTLCIPVKIYTLKLFSDIVIFNILSYLH